MNESDLKPAPSPKRRWSYSLRTLLVVVTLFGCWLGYEVNWLRERHLLIESHTVAVFPTDEGTIPRAPSLLWLFGEEGAGNIHLIFGLDRKPEPGFTESVKSLPTYDRVHRAFPEAEINGVHVSWQSEGLDRVQTPATH